MNSGIIDSGISTLSTLPDIQKMIDRYLSGIPEEMKTKITSIYMSILNRLNSRPKHVQLEIVKMLSDLVRASSQNTYQVAIAALDGKTPPVA